MLIISHRGYISKYPENSLEGIKYALNEDYINGVEFDVRVTKDKKFVLIHDFFIDRVSNGSGLVNKLTYKELLKYNFGNKNKLYKVTKLEDVLKIKSNKIFLMEIKFDYKEYVFIKYKLIKLLKKYNNINLYICSFNKKIINDLSKYFNNYKFGYVSFKKLDTSVSFNAVNYQYYNPNKLKKLSNYENLEVFLWTINNSSDIMKKYVKGIVSDYPNTIRKELL